MLIKTRYILIITHLVLLLSLVNGNLQAKSIPSDNLIQGRLNIINGASAECVMHHFYTQSGWTQIEGEIGRNGIDGLYYKKQNNTIKEVLVAESKWNKSRLGQSGKNKAVKQMSQEWVLRTLNKLVKKLHTKTYKTIRQFIKHDQYRARLFRLKPIGKNSIQITIYSIKNKGYKIFQEIQDTKLKPININKPRNSFEKGIATAYNSCRKSYLHKYLGTLSNTAINTLVKDNYIQKADVKRVLNLKNTNNAKATYQPVLLASLNTNKSVAKKTTKPPPSAIGKVWVNTKSHVYHCSGSRWYGKTKHGRYSDESVAVKTGNRPAQGNYCSSKGQTTNKMLVQSVSSTKVWVNTKSHVYHCLGARWYGKTKHGRFMSESNAVKQGNRGAHGHKCN